MDEQESVQTQDSSAPVVRQTSWPKVVGIIAMVFGVLGSFGGLWGIGTSFFSEALAKMSQLPPDFYDKWKPFMVGSGLSALLLGGLLFLGGLFLTLRKRSASLMLNSWALLKIIYGMVSVYFSYKMQREQMPVMLEQQQKMMEKASPAAAASAEQMTDMISGMADVMGLVGMVFSLAWVMVLPTFIMIWFIRPKIREEVAEWGRAI